ncbi:type VII secretion target [Cellulomonas soli]|uniref:ESX-1 secretion-associated protein n=1 Tax=Cellulomonas soli TaxID=931535 RepID=A0A512PG26_9CELL|nr:type VII secretion target [Cellulomonas soli]NYI58008.1 hypothetical protein [Cellulomonas soli]GEP70143.1 hypothetical protein CSO01_28580 [Cellulomonas soli]
MSQFVVDTEVLNRHASRVQNVASDVRTAQQAAATTDLHSGAFGVLCAFLPAIVSGVDSAAREAIDAVHQATAGTVEELGAMARAYEAVDARVEQVLRGLMP